MSWRLADALSKLRNEVDNKWPYRSKQSDGAIGDEDHASRSSDHNPWVKEHGLGIVTAIDITHDPSGGFDSYAFAEWMRQQKDPRVKYVISNRKIFAGSDGPSPWVWRPYHGANPHDHHIHISVKSDKAHYDDNRSWGVIPATMPEHNEPQPVRTPPTIRLGSRGSNVLMAQEKLKAKGYDIEVDGVFGPITKKTVVAFQQSKGLVADGVVGPQTWKELLNA